MKCASRERHMGRALLLVSALTTMVISHGRDNAMFMDETMEFGQNNQMMLVSGSNKRHRLLTRERHRVRTLDAFSSIGHDNESKLLHSRELRKDPDAAIKAADKRTRDDDNKKENASHEKKNEIRKKNRQGEQDEVTKNDVKAEEKKRDRKKNGASDEKGSKQDGKDDESSDADNNSILGLTKKRNKQIIKKNKHDYDEDSKLTKKEKKEMINNARKEGNRESNKKDKKERKKDKTKERYEEEDECRCEELEDDWWGVDRALEEVHVDYEKDDMDGDNEGNREEYEDGVDDLEVDSNIQQTTLAYGFVLPSTISEMKINRNIHRGKSRKNNDKRAKGRKDHRKKKKRGKNGKGAKGGKSDKSGKSQKSGKSEIKCTCPPSKRPSNKPTKIPTLRPSRTSRPTPNKAPPVPDDPTFSPTVSPTMISSATPTTQPSPEPTTKPTTKPPSNKPTSGPTVAPGTPSKKPTKKPTPSPLTPPTRLPTNKPSKKPTEEPTRKPTSQPTVPSGTPSKKPTERPSPNPSKLPTRLPTPKPSKNPTAKPTTKPTSQPTVPPGTPSRSPTKRPTPLPSKLPTRFPTLEPTKTPTEKPTTKPTSQPTSTPGTPTRSPSKRPTPNPSASPTRWPTRKPSLNPTNKPTDMPTRKPTLQPTVTPGTPSRSPTKRPTPNPTAFPTRSPTRKPSPDPTGKPTTTTTRQPTPKPTLQPTVTPGTPSRSPTKKPTPNPSTTPTDFPTREPSPTEEFIQPNIEMILTGITSMSPREVSLYETRTAEFIEFFYNADENNDIIFDVTAIVSVTNQTPQQTRKLEARYLQEDSIAVTYTNELTFKTSDPELDPQNLVVAPFETEFSRGIYINQFLKEDGEFADVTGVTSVTLPDPTESPTQMPTFAPTIDLGGETDIVFETSFHLALVQEFFDITSIDITGLEEVTLKYLFDNIGGENKFSPEELTIINFASGVQKSSDSSGGQVETFAFQMNVTFSMKQSFVDWIEEEGTIDDSTRRLDFLSHPTQRRMQSKKCSPENYATCCLNGSINQDADSKTCKSFGCNRRRCKKKPPKDNRRLFRELDEPISESQVQARNLEIDDNLWSLNFNEVLRQYTNFEPETTKSILNATDTQSVATCHADRFAEFTNSSAFACDVFVINSCEENEDIEFEEEEEFCSSSAPSTIPSTSPSSLPSTRRPSSSPTLFPTQGSTESNPPTTTSTPTQTSPAPSMTPNLVTFPPTESPLYTPIPTPFITQESEPSLGPTQSSSKIPSSCTTVPKAFYNTNRSISSVENEAEINQYDFAEFGSSLSIWENVAAIGARGASVGSMDPGAVYIFEYKMNDIPTSQYEWKFIQKLTPSNSNGDKVGHSVSLYGEFLAVGAPYDEDQGGVVYVFRRPEASETFQQLTTLVSPTPSRYGYFGWSVAVDEDGDIAVGARRERSDQGSAHVYKRVAGPDWTLVQDFEPDISSFDFGWSIAMDRNFLVIGAPKEGKIGSVFIYKEQTADSWVFSEQLTPNDGGDSDEFGYSVAMDNNNLIVGSPFAATSKDDNAGRVYHYVLNPLSTAVLSSSIEAVASLYEKKVLLFGISVSISRNLLLVGTFDSGPSIGSIGDIGSAHLFYQDGGGQWQFSQIIPDEPPFRGYWSGWSVAINPVHALVGMPLFDDPLPGGGHLSHGGATYFFDVAEVEECA